MKKLLTLALALVMMLSVMSINAFAAETSGTVTTDGGTQNIDVSAKYQTGATTPDVVSVDIAWGAMEFTYSVGGTHDWDPAEHKYNDNTSARWTASGNTVTVTNHSNVAIKAELSFTAEAAYSGITGSFGEDATLLLATAVGTDKNAAPSDTANLTLSGTLASTVTTSTKVGTITVKISKQ